MSHILFLSYASENATDAQFKGFFRDLCRAIAPRTVWGVDDERIAFRDRRNLRLGHQWEPELQDALESSAVMVCVTSPAYFKKAFCGKEFYLFDQMRRQHLASGQPVPPVIIPIIWAPYQMPAVMNEYVWKHDDLPDEYEKDGLRDLRWLKPSLYRKSLAALARSIVEIWKGRDGNDSHLSAGFVNFDHVPNAFGDEEWQEAANGAGWILGPTVANVVYAAATKSAVPAPHLAAKYGKFAREWKPYLPPSPHTVGELAKSVIHGQALRYREIPIDDNFSQEMQSAQARKNLILVMADAASLAEGPSQKLQAFDSLRPEGAALLMPWDETMDSSWRNNQLQNKIDQIFPVKSRTPACFRAPLLSVDEMRSTLETTLIEIRDGLTKSEVAAKPIIDAGPAFVSAPPAAPVI